MSVARYNCLLAGPLTDPRAEMMSSERGGYVSHADYETLRQALLHYACDCGETCEQPNGTCGDYARAALAAFNTTDTEGKPT